MTFARFMELALYDPDAGYYRAASARPGPSRRLPHGPGGPLDLRPDDRPPRRRRLGRARPAVGLHDPGVRSGRRRTRGGTPGRTRRRRIRACRSRPVSTRRGRAPPARRAPCTPGRGRPRRPRSKWTTEPRSSGWSSPTRSSTPCRRIESSSATAGSERSSSDSAESGFTDVEGEPSTPALAERLAAEGIELVGRPGGGDMPRGRRVGRGAAAGLARGVLLLIDYGHPADELYDPVRRSYGTAFAYLGHQAHRDLYHAVGRQDLTAHVDVTAVERAAAAAGLRHLGTTTQGRFLAALGAGDLLVDLQSGPGSRPSGLPRGSGGARPDDRSGGDGRVPGAWRSDAGCPMRPPRAR